jgi:peptidoglycan/LPS O-acetylase OafA/YrhL
VTREAPAAVAPAAGAWDSASPARSAETPALTGLRGIAALWVLLFHAWIVGGRDAMGGAHAWLNFGWLGVDLFFGLSAFLLTSHALSRRERWPAARGVLGEPYVHYLGRRILRVFPAYYACLSILLALSAAGHYGPFPSVPDIAFHLPMLHSLDKHFMDSINGVFWSLPFEWQFYLALPLLLLVMERVGGSAWLVLAAAIAIGAYALAAHLRAEFPLAQLPGRIDTFAVGMACAWWVRRRPLSRAHARWAWTAGAALLLVTPVLFSHAPEGFRPGGWTGISRTLLIDLAVGLVLVGLAADEPLGRRAIGNPPLQALGRVSYSIYLFHLPVILLLSQAGAYAYGQAGTLRVLAYGLPTTLLVATLSWWMFEAPFQRAAKSAAEASRPVERWKPVIVVAAWGVAILAGGIAWHALRGAT